MWWIIMSHIRDLPCDAACQYRVAHPDPIWPMLLVAFVVTFPIFQPQLTYMAYQWVKALLKGKKYMDGKR